jgi:hypothetical protein
MVKAEVQSLKAKGQTLTAVSRLGEKVGRRRCFIQPRRAGVGGWESGRRNREKVIAS